MTSPPSADASRAAAGTVALGGLQTLGRGVALLFVVVATRLIAPAQFGRYSIVAGLVTVAGFLADFGSTTVITRMVSCDPESSDRLLSQTLVASVTVGLLAYATVIAYVVVGPYPRVIVVDVALGGLAIPLDAALTSMLAALDGHGLIARRAIASFARLAVVGLGGTLAVVATGTIRPAIGAIALGPAVGLVLGAVLVRRHAVWGLGLRPDWPSSVRLFRAALPYALLGGIGAMVARLDLIVLSALSSTAEVARYDLALRGVEAVTALGTVVGGPALFILSRRIGGGDLDGARRAYRHAVGVAYLIGLPATAVLVALHGPISRLAFGSSYTGTGSLLAVLGASVWLAVLGWAQGAVVAAGGSTSHALRASVVLLVAAALLDAILIPPFGALGAAIATGGAAVVSCLVFDRLNLRTLQLRTPLPPVALVVCCVLSGLVVGGTATIGAGWWGVAALPVLPLLLWRTGVVTTTDARRLGHLVAAGTRA